MSGREILFRGVEQFWGIRERFARIDQAASAEQAVAALRNAWSRPFFFRTPGASPDALRRDFEGRFPLEGAEILRLADHICSGDFRLFGKDVFFPGGCVDWHRDWETQAVCPQDFYRRIPTFDANRQADAKRVWELNRQQFLVTLGQAFFSTRDSKYSQAAVRFLDSWIEASPPYTGYNWKEALEAGLRLLSWLWTWQLLQDSDEWSKDAVARILRSMELQYEFIAHHLSVYSSPNTHLLGEALALFVLGHILPGMPAARRRAEQGLEILQSQLERQVLEDGSHFEKSAYYHCYALEMYLLATIVGHQYGVAFALRWMSRLEKMAEFLLALVRPDGSLARFGDDDGGKTLRLGREDYSDPRPLLALSAVLFDRPDFKHAAGALPQEVWWLLGPEGARKYVEMPSSAPVAGAQCFPQAEVLAQRTGWSLQDLWLVAQASPWAPGSAGHSHAALLSFEVFVGGRALIVDPGTFTYSECGPWRNYFRSWEAHNTVEVDGNRWWVPADPFKWRREARLETFVEAGSQSLTACYRAIREDGGTWAHRRSFQLHDHNSLGLRDKFEGSGRHRLLFRIQFAPGWRVSQTAAQEFSVVQGGARVMLLLSGFGAFSWKIWEGGETPRAGWYSARFNDKVPAPALLLEENEVRFPAQREMLFVFDHAGTGI